MLFYKGSNMEKEVKNLKLENQLCFALYRASNSMIRYYNKFLLPMGLTYTQYLVLITIEKKTNLKIQDISNILFLNASTISPVIKRLVKLNLIKKKRDSNDERVVTVALTKSGLEILPKLSKVQEIVVCRTGMSEIDFYRFKNELNALSLKLTEEKENDTSENLFVKK